MNAWEDFKHNLRGFIISYMEDGGVTVFTRNIGNYNAGLFIFNPFRIFAIGFIFEKNYFEGLNLNIGLILLGFYLRSN